MTGNNSGEKGGAKRQMRALSNMFNTSLTRFLFCPWINVPFRIDKYRRARIRHWLLQYVRIIVRKLGNRLSTRLTVEVSSLGYSILFSLSLYSFHPLNIVCCPILLVAIRCAIVNTTVTLSPPSDSRVGVIVVD